MGAQLPGALAFPGHTTGQRTITGGARPATPSRARPATPSRAGAPGTTLRDTPLPASFPAVLAGPFWRSLP